MKIKVETLRGKKYGHFLLLGMIDGDVVLCHPIEHHPFMAVIRKVNLIYKRKKELEYNFLDELLPQLLH